MSSKSIVDRVLLFAAAICAAGLVWQLTVLMTSRGQNASFHKMDTASAASVSPSDEPQPSAATPAVRVVYPSADSPKTIGKAIDAVDGTPTALAAPASLTGGSALTVSTATAFAPPDPAIVPAPAASAPSPNPGFGAPSVRSVDLASAPADTGGGASPDTTADQTAVAAPTKMAATEPASPTTEAPAPSTGSLNINQASVDALNHLRGGGRIGQAIASHRPYNSVEDLLKKRVVRRNVYDQIKNQIATQ